MTPEALQTLLRELPNPGTFTVELFQEVPPEERLPVLRTLLERERRIIDLPVRGELFRQHDRKTELYLVLSGSLDEWRGQFRIATRRAGDIVGELPALQRVWPEQGLTATAREPTRVLALSPRSFMEAINRFHGFARVVLRAVAEHAADFVDDESQYGEALDQYFPKGRGRLTPGPYDCRNTTLHLFFCRDGDPTVDEVGDAMPPGLSYWPGAPHYMLGVASMGEITHRSIRERQSFTYDEVMVFVPVRVDGHVRPRFHVPFMFPDNIMAIFLGREIAGLPKLRASTFVDQFPDGLTRLLMRRLGRTELEIRFREVAPAPSPKSWLPGSLAEAWQAILDTDVRNERRLRLAEDAMVWAVDKFKPRLPWSPPIPPRMFSTAWKRVFDPRTRYTGPRRWTPADFQVDALCETPFQITRVHDMSVLELTEPIWFHAEFPVGQSVSISRYGLKVKMDMTMLPGRVLIDYRKRLRYRRSRQLDWMPG